LVLLSNCDLQRWAAHTQVWAKTFQIGTVFRIFSGGQRPSSPPESQALWCDLLFHFVGVHHGHLRPSLEESGLTPGIESDKQNPLRLEAARRFVRLQRLLGRWRLAYLEVLLKTADAQASRVIPGEEHDED
jgi:hypothetical protein